ncbi:uncharacterized protein LOC130726136 isoform X2 [Lotus japonicus]|uniref:uncharacterized protein LOC130726136 isoform X2 n=1 Tax=Lotus japonicus TaxID=34305 RepID=UPI00258F15B2|nr:uncharacterized protein LOC130726136 isoform X2 [Lotus japonicus]
MLKKKLDIAVEFMKFTWNYLVVPAVIMVMNVPDEVAGIKVDVKGVRARSREAYRKAAEAEDGDTRDRMERRASQLREVAFHMEDVIDEYKNKCEVQQPCCYPGCGALPCHDADFVNTTCYHRLQIALKIKCIQSELLKIDKRIEKEDNKVKSSSAAQEQRRRSHSTVIRNDWESLPKEAIYMPPDDIVGFEGHCDKLISWLEMNQPQCTVFALVGMGG